MAFPNGANAPMGATPTRLTSEQLQHLERRLREERDRLMTHVRAFAEEQSEKNSEEPGGSDSKAPLHPADLGSDVQHEELEATLATRRSEELAEIDAALERLATSPDSYGRDEITGDGIPFERLDVIPYARWAVEPTVPPARD